MSFAFVLVTALGFALCACSSSQTGPVPSDPTRAAPTESPVAPASSAVAQPTIPRTQAAQLAEQFVRAQGYTDQAALPTTTLVPESLEATDRDEVLSIRAGTLQRRHVGAHPEGDGWLVLFAYRSPTRPEFGRALRMRADQSMEMVHQDIRLPEPLEPVTLVGRLVATDDRGADCGTMHFAVIAEYEVLEVAEGAYAGEWVMVIVGCPELPRARYGEGAGDLAAFTVGDTHRLRLVPHPPDATGGFAFIDSGAHPELHRYWVAEANAVPAQP